MTIFKNAVFQTKILRKPNRFVQVLLLDLKNDPAMSIGNNSCGELGPGITQKTRDSDCELDRLFRWCNRSLLVQLAWITSPFNQLAVNDAIPAFLQGAEPSPC